jgi:hypothetical protein
MGMQFPQRHQSHTLAYESEQFFRDTLPRDWVVHKPEADYGQDLRIELTEDGQLRGCELVVQIKASETPSGNERYESIQGLKVSTYNYLKRVLPVVMFVKYVRSERKAYWVYLGEIPPPSDVSQETLTVRVPKANRLSELTWSEVATHVRKVTHRKLNAGEGLMVFLRGME